MRSGLEPLISTTKSMTKTWESPTNSILPTNCRTIATSHSRTMPIVMPTMAKVTIIVMAHMKAPTWMKALKLIRFRTIVKISHHSTIKKMLPSKNLQVFALNCSPWKCNKNKCVRTFKAHQQCRKLAKEQQKKKAITRKFYNRMMTTCLQVLT